MERRERVKGGRGRSPLTVRYVALGHSEEAATKLVRALRDGITGVHQRQKKKESERGGRDGER